MPYVLDKRWYLLEAPDDYPFMISDNPIVLANNVDERSWGSIGFAVPGIEIYLPLSPKLQLAMACHTHLERARSSVTQYKKLKSDLKKVGLKLSGELAVEWENYESTTELLSDWATAMETGGVLKSDRDVVVRHNADQTIAAERFIYSNSDDFSLTEQILSDNPKYKTGPRGRVG